MSCSTHDHVEFAVDDCEGCLNWTTIGWLSAKLTFVMEMNSKEYIVAKEMICVCQTLVATLWYGATLSCPGLAAPLVSTADSAAQHSMGRHSTARHSMV